MSLCNKLDRHPAVAPLAVEPATVAPARTERGPDAHAAAALEITLLVAAPARGTSFGAIVSR
jgi:hypothetical protein